MSELENEVSLNLPPEEKTLLEQLAKRENTNANELVRRIIKEKLFEKEHVINPKDEIALLDSVIDQLDRSNDPQAVREELVAHLLVAKIELDIKTGKFSKEKTLEYVKELF